MKKLFTTLTLVIFLAAGTGMVFAQGIGERGPAPNAGDGIPDGSGFDSPNGPNGNDATAKNGLVGPAPNAGDGIPDGSGFDSPNGPNGSDAAAENGRVGPAPNAGDGIPDGSGFDSPNGPNK